MKKIEVSHDLSISIYETPVLAIAICNESSEDIVVVYPCEISALREALAEAAGIIAATVSGEL